MYIIINLIKSTHKDKNRWDLYVFKIREDFEEEKRRILKYYTLEERGLKTVDSIHELSKVWFDNNPANDYIYYSINANELVMHNNPIGE